jgi:hypothetical protein
MNTQLVESIIQVVQALPKAEGVAEWRYDFAEF